MYIRDLPPEILFQLYSMLDAPGRRNWERLGPLAGFRLSDIESFRRAQFARASPTEELLRVWGYKLATVTMLYEALAEMKHGLAMKLLKPFVDPKLHYKIREVEGEPLDNGGPSGQWQGDHRAGVNQPAYTPPAQQYTGPAPLMTPDRSVPEQPSFPHRPPPAMEYAPYEQWEQPSYQPTGYRNGQMNVASQMSPGHQPRLDYSIEQYDPPPAGPAYLQHSPQGNPLRSNIELTKKEQRDCDEQAAFAATIHKSYAEIRQATNNFDGKNLLGEGSFGKVYRALIGGTEYAVKVLQQNELVQVAVHNNHRADQRKELVALAKFKHSNIVLMCFFSVDGENPCIIYEYLENGSLEDNLLGKDGRKPLSWEKRQKIADGTALAINHLHTACSNKPLIHGDIKSANILLNKYFEPKLGDFGLARPGPLNGKTCTILKTQFAHGTLPYLPEEFKRNLQLSTKVDSFSFGVVLMEVLTGERAYDKRREPNHELLPDKVKEMMEQDIEGAIAKLKDKKCPEWPDELFKEMLVLANRLTCKSRHNRPELGTVVSELKRMNARFGLATSPEPEHPIPTQNSDPLPDSSTDDSGNPKKTDPGGSELSAEEERQKTIDEFGKKCDSRTSNLASKMSRPAAPDRSPSPGGHVGPDGRMGYDANTERRMYMRQNGQVGPGQGGQNWHGEHMRQESFPGQNGVHEQPPGKPLAHGGPMGPYGHMQQQQSTMGHGGGPQYGHPVRQASPDHPSMYSPREVSPFSREAGPRWGPQESMRRFPADYLSSQEPMGANQLSGQYVMTDIHSPRAGGPPDHLGTKGPISNAPQSYMPRKDTEVQQAFSEGYQRGKAAGYQEGRLAGYQEAYRELKHQMNMPPLHSRDMAPPRQYPSQSPNGMHPHMPPSPQVPPSPNTPTYRQGSPVGGYSFSSDLRGLHSPKSDPARHTLANKTDDAKITNPGDEKSLQTKEISLKEMRQQKEPQQYTEEI